MTRQEMINELGNVANLASELLSTEGEAGEMDLISQIVDKCDDLKTAVMDSYQISKADLLREQQK